MGKTSFQDPCKKKQPIKKIKAGSINIEVALYGKGLRLKRINLLLKTGLMLSDKLLSAPGVRQQISISGILTSNPMGTQV